jgi:hypothetical protein
MLGFDRLGAGAARNERKRKQQPASRGTAPLRCRNKPS